MYRIISLFFVLLLALAFPDAASAHVGDVTVHVKDFKRGSRVIPNCPIAVVISRHGHTHSGTTDWKRYPDGSRAQLQHSQISYRVGYGYSGRGFQTGPNTDAATPDTREVQFPAAQFGNYLGGRDLSQGRGGWQIYIVTNADVNGITYSQAYNDHKMRWSGTFSPECLQALSGVSSFNVGNLVYNAQPRLLPSPTPRPTAVPTPTPRPAPQPTAVPAPSAADYEARLRALEQELYALSAALHNLMLRMGPLQREIQQLRRELAQ